MDKDLATIDSMLRCIGKNATNVTDPVEAVRATYRNLVTAREQVTVLREALMKLAGWFEALQGTDTNDPLWMMRQRAHEVPRKIIADALYPTE